LNEPIVRVKFPPRWSLARRYAWLEERLLYPWTWSHKMNRARPVVVLPARWKETRKSGIYKHIT